MRMSSKGVARTGSAPEALGEADEQPRQAIDLYSKSTVSTLGLPSSEPYVKPSFCCPSINDTAKYRSAHEYMYMLMWQGYREQISSAVLSAACIEAFPRLI